MRTALIAASALYAVSALSAAYAGDKGRTEGANRSAETADLPNSRRKLDGLVRAGAGREGLSRQPIRRRAPRTRRSAEGDRQGRAPDIHLRRRQEHDLAARPPVARLCELFPGPRRARSTTDFRRGSFGDATEAVPRPRPERRHEFPPRPVRHRRQDRRRLAVQPDLRIRRQRARKTAAASKISICNTTASMACAFAPARSVRRSATTTRSSNADSLFLERASPSELAAPDRRRRRPHRHRRLSRTAKSGSASLAVTGAPIATQSFDEQLALVGRVAWPRRQERRLQPACRRQRDLSAARARPGPDVCAALYAAPARPSRNPRRRHAPDRHRQHQHRYAVRTGA